MSFDPTEFLEANRIPPGSYRPALEGFFEDCRALGLYLKPHANNAGPRIHQLRLPGQRNPVTVAWVQRRVQVMVGFELSKVLNPSAKQAFVVWALAGWPDLRLA